MPSMDLRLDDLGAWIGVNAVLAEIRTHDYRTHEIRIFRVVDSVDFHHKNTYCASTDTTKDASTWFVFDPIFSAETSSESGKSLKEKDGGWMIPDDEVVPPIVFMGVACRLMVQLAGAEDG